MSMESSEIPQEIADAVSDPTVRKVLQSICRSVLQSTSKSGQSLALSGSGETIDSDRQWSHLGRTLQVRLLEQMARVVDEASRLQFHDIAKDLNPARNIWSLCFDQFVQRSVQATNHVTSFWSSSSSDRLNIRSQGLAIRQRDVSIQRILIVPQGAEQNGGLPERVLHELRFTAIQQLNAGIKLHITTPQRVQQFADTSLLKTLDFIIFDGAVVYTTVVDRETLDQRDRKSACVQIYTEQEMVDSANTAWAAILASADELTSENLSEHLDPYGVRND